MSSDAFEIRCFAVNAAVNRFCRPMLPTFSALVDVPRLHAVAKIQFTQALAQRIRVLKDL